jgi:hypothetical protein
MRIAVPGNGSLCDGVVQAKAGANQSYGERAGGVDEYGTILASTTCCAHSRAKNRVEFVRVGRRRGSVDIHKDREAAGAVRKVSGHTVILLRALTHLG